MQPMACGVYVCVKTLTVVNMLFFILLPSDGLLHTATFKCNAANNMRSLWLSKDTYCDEHDLFRTSAFRSNAASGLWSLWLCKDTYCDEHGLLPTATFRDSPEVTLCCKLQALVYDILPSTAAVFNYAIGSRKLSANEQFFVGARTVVSLLRTTQIISDVCFMLPCCLRQLK